MSDPFIIYALPRSRTAWLSRYLTYAGWVCGHEKAITVRSMRDIVDYFSQPGVGTAETAAAQGWWLWHHYVPNLRAIVVRRAVDDVMRSMLAVDISPMRYDIGILRRNMNYGARMLDQISAQENVLTLDYEDLDTERGCKTIFEHCLMQPFDRGWWLKLREQNIQVDVRSVLNYYHANRDAVENTKRLCKSELRRLARDGSLLRTAA